MEDDRKRAITWLRQGLAYGRNQRAERAVLCLVSALEHLDEQREPRLVLSGLHNLAQLLIHLDHMDLARMAIARAKPLYRRLDDPIMTARMWWIEGTLARRRERFRLAASKLQRAEIAFRRLDAREVDSVRREREMVERLLAKPARSSTTAKRRRAQSM